MHCTKRITDDMIWVGADDRRLSLFEGVYGVPEGVSYNSYLILDEQTILFDTVDKAVAHNFFDNVAYGLEGRKLDYLVISPHGARPRRHHRGHSPAAIPRRR